MDSYYDSPNDNISDDYNDYEDLNDDEYEYLGEELTLRIGSRSELFQPNSTLTQFEILQRSRLLDLLYEEQFLPDADFYDPNDDFIDGDDGFDLYQSDLLYDDKYLYSVPVTSKEVKIAKQSDIHKTVNFIKG